MRIGLVAAAINLALLGAAHSSNATADIRRHTNIPAQALRPALQALSKERDLQLVFRTDLVGDLKTSGAVGELTFDEALARLLSGTGLTFRYLDEKTITITAIDLSGKTADSISQLNGRWNSDAEGDPASGRSGALLWLAQVSEQSGIQTRASSDGQASSANAGSSEDSRLEEVIVTARKVSERLQDVPASISTLSGSQLEQLGAVDLKDVLRSVPGLSFSNVERGLSRYNIRGVASAALSPTTGVYLDDISLLTESSGEGFFGAFDPVFFDMERLEVLKGPQGTLYGGSAMGGAIKYVSARPNLSAFSSSAAAGIATIAHGSESYNAEGVLNLPLIPDVLAVRAGVFYRHEGGFIDNVAGGEVEDTTRSSTPSPTYTPLTLPSLSTFNRDDYNSSDTYAGRLSLLWQPDPSWSIRPSVFYQNSTLDNPAQFFTNQGGLSASYRVKQPTKEHAGIYSLDITKELRGVQITSLTGYFDRQLDWGRDYSHLIASLLPQLSTFTSPVVYSKRVHAFSQELRIASPAGSDARLRWLGGLYYRDLTESFRPTVTVIDGPDLFWGNTENFLNGLGKADYKDTSAFGEATYRLTDALEFTAGVRVFKIEQHRTDYQGGWLAGPTGFVVTPPRSVKEDGVNPKVGLSYKLSDAHLLYASAAKGFRAGGSNGERETTEALDCADDLERLGYDGVPAQYDSDTVWSYELGSKNEFNDGRMMLNGALFYTDWSGIVQNILLTGCGASFNDNLGTARIQGAELETRFNVTNAFQIGGSATYTDAQLVEIPPGATGAAREGDRIQDVPEWMASAYGSYSIPVAAAWDLQLRAEYQYRSSARREFDRLQQVAFPDTNVPGFIPNGAEFQEGYEVVNAFASLDRGATNVRLYVNNLLDAQPFIDTDFGSGSSRSTTIRPRTVGLEVRRQF